MKKALLSTFLLLIAASGMAQNIGEAFYVYRNDGQFNAFFRDEIDSIAYSYYDQDSVRYEEIVTQLIYTSDSLYRIPLAAIDSVGFVQPETIYREEAIPLVGELYEYLIDVDSLCLTFSYTMPANLIPKVDDKIVATEITEKLPNGFIGKVKHVKKGAHGIDVYCDSLALEETVSQFYGVLEIVNQDGVSVRRYINRKAPVETTHQPLNFNIPEITIPISWDGIITPRKVFGIGGKASCTIGISPTVTGRIVRVVDDRTHISYINLHAVADIKTKHTIEVAGIAKTETPKGIWLVDRDFPTPWGIPVYFAIGPMLEVSGELAVGNTFYADFRYTVDVTLYPATLPYYILSNNPAIRFLFQNAVNRVNTFDHKGRLTHIDVDWGYFAARGSIKFCNAVRLGLSIVNHNAAWLGGEAQFGTRADAEINVNFDDISDAENNTAFYDALIRYGSLTIMPYWGIQAVVSGFDDRMNLKVGHDNLSYRGIKWQPDFIPVFSDTKVVRKDANAEASANITSVECLFPYTVGFSIFDDQGNRIDEPQWNNQKFQNRNHFTFPLKTIFHGLASDKKYKVYPTLRLLGFNVLASPSAELDMHFPVTLSDFKVTKKQYKPGGFTHEDMTYDYSFDVSITATLDDDVEDITDWGYIYRDPNGKEAEISLSKFGKQYTDTRWVYYRNEAHSTCTLYGYVKYEGSNEIVYGPSTDYELNYSLCPDDNHPHAIDLGLPSGTKWCCCNVNAHLPEEFGGYYAYGEVSEKNSYSKNNYMYVQVGQNIWSDIWYNIGYKNDISGTRMDVAYNVMGKDWKMPTKNNCEELVDNCDWTWATYKGVSGYKVVGPSGNYIFMPAAGFKSGFDLNKVGERGVYRSSIWTIHNGYANSSFGIDFTKEEVQVVNYSYKVNGETVRAISSN